MTDIEDSHLAGVVINPIENSVVTDSNPPPFFYFAAKKLGSGRPGIRRVGKDCVVKLLGDELREPFKLPGCSRVHSRIIPRVPGSVQRMARSRPPKEKT